MQDKGMKKVPRKGVTPTSVKPLKSFNSCAGNFFSNNPAAYQGRTKAMWLTTDRSGVHPNCKNASNPFHKCAEYCLKNIPNRDLPVMKLKGLEDSIRGRTSLQPLCIYSSNPQHECTEICFQNVADSNTRVGEKSIDASTNTDKSSPVLNHLHASIPYLNDVECCFENTPEQKHPHKALNPKEEIKTFVATENEVKPVCKKEPLYQLDDEFCFQNLPKDHDLQAMKKAKEEMEIVSIPQREMNSSCENLSDSYIDYCFTDFPEDQPGLAVKKSKEEDKIAPGEIWVNPECQFASNPFHACAEYCFQNAREREMRGHVKKIISLRKTVSNSETSMHARCQFASNPYHDCGADCFQNELDQNKSEEAIMKPKSKNKIIAHGERGVNPKCQFASNPYHVCVKYCIQNAPEREKHGHGKLLLILPNCPTLYDFQSNQYIILAMKLNNHKELRKVVSNRETANLQPGRCNFTSNSYHECDAYCFQNELDQNIGERVAESKDGKKEASDALRGDVNTMSKFTSNPFHKFSEYYEGHPDKNQPVECIPVITMENKRNSPRDKRDHLIMEKSTANLEFVEALKPIYNNVESVLDPILPDRIEKSSKDSIFVEASNPDSNYAEFSEGITMQIVTTDLMPEVEAKITKEPSEVQSLQLDASDLFVEWAKYCSQERAADYKIVMQERRASEAKNGQENDNLKCYDSSNLEKVKAEGSLQRSLPTSVLFFLGFFFALFKWTQMIHTLVMSSERKKSSGRVMHRRYIESK